GRAMRASSRAPAVSNRHSSTLSACAENSTKFVPVPSKLAPSGDGTPALTRMLSLRGRAADRDSEFDCKAAWCSADFPGPGQHGDRKADDHKIANSNIDGLCDAQLLWCSIKVHASATDPDTDRILERAVQWGIETQHHDGLGRHRLVAP